MVLVFLLLLIFPPADPRSRSKSRKKPSPTVIIKPKHPVLSAEQRAELGFPEDMIAKIELSAGAEAEPFFTTVFVPSENLKGEKGFEKQKLAGFSVRTKKADDLIYGIPLRASRERIPDLQERQGIREPARYRYRGQGQ